MIIAIRVTPGAKKNMLVKLPPAYQSPDLFDSAGENRGGREGLNRKQGEVWKVYLTAPPVEGKANRALIEFLADTLKVKRSQISIIKGLKSRDKIVKIND